MSVGVPPDGATAAGMTFTSGEARNVDGVIPKRSGR